MSKYKVVLADVKFANDNGHKVRPVLVIKDKGNSIEGRVITSKEPRKDYPGEYPIQDINSAGLNIKSTIRMSKHVTISKKKIYKELGELDTEDAKNVEKLENTPYKESYNPDDVIDEFLYNYIK